MNENAINKVKTLRAKYANLQEAVGNYGSNPFEVALSFILGFILILVKYTVLPLFLFITYYIYTEGSQIFADENAEKTPFDGVMATISKSDEEREQGLHYDGLYLKDKDGFVYNFDELEYHNLE